MNLDTSSLPPILHEPPRPIFKEPTRSIPKITSVLETKISINEEKNTAHSTLKPDRTYEIDKELRKSNYWGTAHIQKNTKLYGMNLRIQGLVSALKDEEAQDGKTKLPSDYTIEDIEDESQWTPTLEKIQHDAKIESRDEMFFRLRTVEESHQKKHERSEIERANRIFRANQKLPVRPVAAPSIRSRLKTSPSVYNLTTLDDDVTEIKRRRIDNNDTAST